MALTKIPSNLITLDAIDGTLIADDAINSEHIANGAIDAAHMSVNSIDSDSYVDGSIDTAHIGDDQVTAAKLANAINTSISDKLPLGGGTLTGNADFGNNLATRYGGSQQLQIYHNGTRGYITNTSGALWLQTSDFRVYKGDGSERMIQADDDGSVLLYYDGNSKLSTLTGGINITGDTDTDTLTVSGTATVGGTLGVTGLLTATAGVTTAANQRVQSSSGMLFLTGASAIPFEVGAGSEKMRLTSTGLGIGTSSPAVELHIHDASGLAAIRLSGTASSADNFQIMQGVTGVTNAGFSIYDVDATTNRLVIDTNGKVLVGQTSAVTNGKLQVTGGIGLTGNSEIRSSTNSDNGDTIKFFGTQFVAGSNSHSYGYSEGGYIASLATAGNAILLDAGNTTANTGHRFRVINAGNGVDGSIQYWDGTTSRFHVDSSTGIIKENDIPVRSRAIAMAMVFG
jgi:hypothetical protein